MKTILVAMDFTSIAARAAAYAAALAQEIQARLILYHALSLKSPVTRNYPLIEQSISSLQDENNERMGRVAAELSEQYGISVAHEQTNELFLDGINKAAKRLRADLLVMGIRGDSLPHKLFGSVTIQAIRETHFPLLVVPEEARYQKIKKILFAWENDKLTQEADLSPILRLAKETAAEIMILHVERATEKAEGTSLPKEVQPRLEAIFRDIKHSYTYIRKREVVAGIESGITTAKADIVVMLPHHHGFVDSILHSSETRKMALHTHIPLLVLPTSQKEYSLAESTENGDGQGLT